jgi:hypothetical protein
MLSEIMDLLAGLDKEWVTQGASPGELDLTDFGFDYVENRRRKDVTVRTGNGYEIRDDRP